MSDKINNPFLSGAQSINNDAPTPQNQQQTAPAQSPQQAQMMPAQQTQNPTQQAPTGQQPAQPSQSPFAQSPFTQSPFTQSSAQPSTQPSGAPQQANPHMAPSIAPTQPQMPQQQVPQQAATSFGQSPFVQNAVPPQQPQQPQQMPQQQMPQQQIPQQQMPQQQMLQRQMPQQQMASGRMTAADPQSTPKIKKPSPFDFAAQSTGAGGASKAQATQASAGAPRYMALSFTGGVGQLYGIMIVNYFLSLITLGIWAPWAKVRTMRYFFGHTEFLDHGLEFLATGKQLFVGRLIAIIVLIALGLFEFVPFVGPALAVIIVIAGIPYVLNRSLGFKARFLAWRDVRFNWHGSYGNAILIFTILPLLSLITLGLAQPVAARALRKHYADNHAFGGADFSADLSLGSYYMALLKSVFFFIILTLLLGGPTGALGFATLTELGLLEITSYEELAFIFAILTPAQQIMLILPIFAAGFAFYMASSFYMALSRHVMVNNLRLRGGIRFRSKLSAFRFAMIMVTNLFINIITIGFAYPYTIVRRYRYLVESIEIRPIADMAGFIDHQHKSGFSVFEEASDIEGLSIDI